jgi:hypothetical protein
MKLGDLVQLTFASPMMDDCMAIVLKENPEWNAIVVIATTGKSTGKEFSAYKSNAKLISSLP